MTTFWRSPPFDQLSGFRERDGRNTLVVLDDDLNRPADNFVSDFLEVQEEAVQNVAAALCKRHPTAARQIQSWSAIRRATARSLREAKTPAASASVMTAAAVRAFFMDSRGIPEPRR